MAQAPKLEHRQTQRLTMTPELQLSLKILQFDQVDLASYLASEIENNPLIEFSDEGTPAPPREEGADESEDPRGPEPIDADLYTSVFTNDAGAENTPEGQDYTQDYNGGFHEAHAQPSVNGGKNLEPNFQREETFHDHIHDQLPLLMFEPKAAMIANYLAESLDEAGYIAPPLDEVAAALGCAEKEVEEVLRSLQDLEPAGIFARDLKECLKLQLKDKGRCDNLALEVLNHLDLIARNDISGLAKVCKTSEKEIIPRVKSIRKLDPKPGLQFADSDPLQTLIPDIFVHQGKRGAWRIDLNNDALPRLLINEKYSLALKDKPLKKNDSAYLRDCQARAGWLKRALDQRAQTILRVSQALVDHQLEFFESGVRHMRPFTYGEIAKVTDLHESTISRVVQNKYLSCPRGVFKMRYFFSASLAAEGAHTSGVAVKDRIRELIDREKAAKPLSDEKLSKFLKADGITISRRTVMKYRESLKISSSFERRQKKI